MGQFTFSAGYTNDTELSFCLPWRLFSQFLLIVTHQFFVEKFTGPMLKSF
jgi:hypothetical protein